MIVNLVAGMEQHEQMIAAPVNRAN
jgi:hypothetical protein